MEFVDDNLYKDKRFSRMINACPTDEMIQNAVKDQPTCIDIVATSTSTSTKTPKTARVLILNRGLLGHFHIYFGRAKNKHLL